MQVCQSPHLQETRWLIHNTHDPATHYSKTSVRYTTFQNIIHISQVQFRESTMCGNLLQWLHCIFRCGWHHGQPDWQLQHTCVYPTLKTLTSNSSSPFWSSITSNFFLLPTVLTLQSMSVPHKFINITSIISSKHHVLCIPVQLFLYIHKEKANPLGSQI